MAETTEQVTDQTLQDLETSTAEASGFSLFHLLTFGSIAASIYLYSQGRKQDGIFVGLWAPTFEALRSSFSRR
ncbi:MAG: hypothetical protein BRD29_01160 [Bacteroidetes bacterium QH_2_67_10]|jgi:hypothetical protein|nr:MAG: hypothetical protein BRD29_01160 [Bacteroidetes bacterium QH_2_67_10]PSQ71588.1 MAG: hypothetical protein BRD38_01505 [Bacteroidetes bacterium QH_9_67_14]PSQ79037.1 MAG: hypothetical protein BRD37_01400 [Bacteroidetes bacterium QH_8_67_23]PSQ93079.1 MAG: hypothetical protein BRD52_02685 [Bacteroidetes bacterium SW_4_67_19]